MNDETTTETLNEQAERLAETYSPALGGPVGMAECGCPNNLLGAPPALHLCRTCGFEGGYDSVHQQCAGCAYLAEQTQPAGARPLPRLGGALLAGDTSNAEAARPTPKETT